jgi:hypothetical protein
MIYTFGWGHECKCGRPLRNCYTVLPDRDTMVKMWGVKWAHEYESEEAAATWALKRIDTNRSDPLRCVCNRGIAPDYELVPLACTWCDLDIGALVFKRTDAGPPKVDARMICARCKATAWPC